VQITPVSRGGRRAAAVFQAGAVQITVQGGAVRELRREIRKALDRFARQVADEIEAGAEESHHGALG
jgi:hypothetical protein